MGKRKEVEPEQETTESPVAELVQSELEELAPNTDAASEEPERTEYSEGDYSKIPEGDFSIIWKRPSGNEITTKATKQMIAHAEANGWIPVGEVGYDPEAKDAT